MTDPASPRPRASALHPVALACLLATAGAGATFAPAASAQEAAAASSSEKAYAIPGGALGPALAAFAAQSGVNLSFTPAQTQGRSTTGLQGRYTVGQGFAALLAGSGLQAVPHEGGGYTLRAAPAAAAAATPAGALTLSEVRVAAQAERNDGTTEGTGSYTAAGPSAAATGLPLTLRETPQSVSVMSRQRMDDFQLQTLSDVLDQTPGVTVSRQSDMTTFNVRGSTVNLKVDGNRLLASGWGWNSHILYALDDMAEIDRVEVLKGSSGLMSGDGNYGGTVNLIRKRPTRDFQAHASAGVGSWSSYRADADISGPLNEAGTLRGRLVAAHKDADAFRDRQHHRNTTLYGTLEADITPDTVVGAGITYKERSLRGATGTTPIQAFSGDGVAVPRMPRSFNVGASWAGYEQESLGLFARLEHRFAGGWKAKLQVARDSVDTPDMRIGYLRYALPGQIQYNRYAGIDDRNDSISLDVQGPFQLFGRTHDLLIGAGSTRARTTLQRGSGASSTLTAAGIDYADGGAGVPEPDWNSMAYSNDLFSRKNRYLYAASRFNIADPVKLIAGARVSDYDQKDVTDIGWYNYDMRERGVVTPYAGLIVDVAPQVSVYGSYASIYQPQSAKDAGERTLPPEEGRTYELGAKGEFFDKRLNASIAHFWMRTDNTAEEVGLNANGDSIYRAVKGATRRGYELELSGELARGWQAQGSYVMNSSNLDSASTTPRHQFKLGSSYRFGDGALQGLTVGGALRWQSAIATSRGSATLRQDAYWLFDLMARYQVSRQLSISANLNNVFDKRYFAGVTNFSAQGLFYTWGAPRSVNVSARYDF
ncbi:TonB-dependent siderophore receptor [Paracidovorax wautersii]|uniref:Outer membrane receptor for ferric coprogen and ferric-rhodotorulic acid n=1 Tax=Paracidovorax wautersii TaxID=1177982 RepID=A0ABU1IBA2_9BURK|nr:TonB-dependent siderophore receptor [Paracidovorax wautersii]MDR6213733.1 outer membrane receptor for ferric coprogen and ferric-rhodotorulic acid [Paracidovorax wautersii]